MTSFPRAPFLPVAFLPVACLLSAIAATPAHAGGTKPAPPPAKGKPAAPPAKPAPPAKAAALPAGCERLADGVDAVLSRDGKRVAFVRWKPGSEVDYHGIRILEPQVVVRDLVAKKDSVVPGAKAQPVEFTDAGGLGLSTGVVVDPASGKRVPGTAAVPAGTKLCAVAWSRDGKRLLFAADFEMEDRLRKETQPPPYQLVDGSGAPVPFDLGNNLYTDNPVGIAWSPDGKRVASNAVWFEMGHVPPRRTSVIVVEGPSMETVAEMPAGNGIPTLNDERRPMRALPGTTGPRIGTDVWDAASAHFVYVYGTGDGIADVYLATADGSERFRTTTDGATKWSPALDPACTRVAFVTGQVARASEPIVDGILRVVDVRTGDVEDRPLPGAGGLPGRVAWFPDGTRVLYEIHGGSAEGVYAQTVSAAKPAPEGTAFRNAEVSPLDEITQALLSGQPKRATEACKQARTLWNDAFVPVLRKALIAWKDVEYGPAWELLNLLVDQDAKEAIPEIKTMLRSTQPRVAGSAAWALERFGAKEALPDLDAIRTKAGSPELRVRVAGTMVVLGDARGWPELVAGAKDKEPDVRSALCGCLARIRDPRSVELLLALVGDDGELYVSHGGQMVVGDEAVRALAKLSGKFFHRDGNAWATWWKEAGKALPEPVDATEALAAYAAWMDEREAAYQKKMQDEIDRHLPPKKK